MDHGTLLDCRTLLHTSLDGALCGAPELWDRAVTAGLWDAAFFFLLGGWGITWCPSFVGEVGCDGGSPDHGVAAGLCLEGESRCAKAVVVLACEVAPDEEEQQKATMKEEASGGVGKGVPGLWLCDGLGGTIGEDVDGDVVVSACLVGELDEEVSGLLCRVVLKDLSDGLIFEFTMKAIGADQDPVATLESPGWREDLDEGGLIAAKDPRQDVLSWVVAGLFFSQDPSFDESLYGAVVAAESVKLPLSQEIEPAVTDVSCEEVAILDEDSDTGRAHAFEGWLFTGALSDDFGASLNGFTNGNIGFHVGVAFCEVVHHRLDGEGRSDLSTTCAAHSVGDDE